MPYSLRISGSGSGGSRNSRGISEIPQFALTLFVLFLIVLLPLLDFASVFAAAAIQYLATNDVAAKAATQANYPAALTAMSKEASQFMSYGLAKLVKLTPSGGYNGCGSDLYILATDLGTGTLTSSQANQPLTQPINTTTSMYEMSAKSTYLISPFIDLSSVPVLRSVPGLGVPVLLTFCANRPAEHPGGLAVPAKNAGATAGGAVLPFNRQGNSAPASPAPPSGTTWRTPDIYNQITNAGQTIVSQSVVTVSAAAGSWTAAGVPTIQPGDKVWIDTQATGNWQISPAGFMTAVSGGGTTVSANGLTSASANGHPYGALVGGIFNPLAGMTLAANPFLLGVDTYNYPPPAIGVLCLAANVPGMTQGSGMAITQAGLGQVMVRVIIAR